MVSASRRQRLQLAGLLVLLGVVGRLLLLDYANVETVLVASMLAGLLLGGLYLLAVPLVILLVTDAILYGTSYGNLYPLEAVLGLSAFVYTGFLFVSVVGRSLRGRVLLRVKGVALLTTASVPATILYDVWTAFGDWLFLARYAGLGLLEVYQLQVPFTLMHVMSSLIFVPLFGTAFLVLDRHLASAEVPGPAPQDGPEPS
jgi:hypothetical protein